MTTTEAPRVHEPTPVTARMGVVDRLLPVWIGAAMVLGLGLGRLIPGLNDTLDAVKLDTVSLPIALACWR